jgi:hypothetical protein
MNRDSASISDTKAKRSWRENEVGFILSDWKYNGRFHGLKAMAYIDAHMG